ncbi:hypothetical protein LEP48_01270 [Isoptericola sp. NEAU-Y5]|uniref:Uncharacterized protein n=1 Tax=Isoptericola luteus TaxID=2879484 RepID=A0ABS7ZDX8_9MICO|nr:hypothetical protein [Isoptericola sp. NEAU-Y5]MCA5891980.1 hypothetical protein [Isoptericola sp. NEAU-Y5]
MAASKSRNITTAPGLVSLADLLPPTGHYNVSVALHPESLREVLSGDLRRTTALRDLPPAFKDGPLAAPGTGEALQALAEERTAHNAAVAAFRAARADRAALPSDSTPGEVEGAEVAQRDARRAEVAAERAKVGAEHDAVRVIYDVTEDLVTRRREAYAAARAVAVNQATEAIASLTEALTVTAADEYVNGDRTKPRTFVVNTPAGSEHLAALIQHVETLNGTAEPEWRQI